MSEYENYSAEAYRSIDRESQIEEREREEERINNYQD